MNKPCKYCVYARIDVSPCINMTTYHEDYRREECRSCKKLAKYRDALAAKRKFIKGEPILTMDQFAKWLDNNVHLFWHGRIYHIGWFCSLQYRMIEQQVKRGNVFQAVKRKVGKWTISKDDTWGFVAVAPGESVSLYSPDYDGIMWLIEQRECEGKEE
ncbi:MAG: hypothetical protein II897_04165 [Clostridia bacterium]|nr:hypothetical protein [Clostridia bacterium]